MADTQQWTIKDLLDWTTDYLAKNGSESSRLDAEVLLAHVMAWPRIQLYAQFDVEPSEEQRGSFRELIKQRAKGVPVAYLIGTKEFFSLELAVSPDVLIPRPETEFAVVRALDLLRQTSSRGTRLRCLDLGTGSGAIAIALARQLPDLEIVAADISVPALSIARRNVIHHGLEDRIRLIESDLFERLPPGEPFDLIVSNPPYIGLNEKASLQRDVADFEPGLALFSGATGVDCSTRIIAEASELMLAGGWLVLESSPLIVEHLSSLIQNDPRYSGPALQRDLAGLPRVISAQKVAL